jgi:hypothetical protein
METIEKSVSFETAIPIISAEKTLEGIRVLQERSLQVDNAIVISIERGGAALADYLERPAPGIKVPKTKMQLSHKAENGDYLPTPRLIYLPNIYDIINVSKGTVRSVRFAEAVVESEATIIEATKAIKTQFDDYNRNHLSHHPYPVFYTSALINKINGLASFPNFDYAFEVDKVIWVAGLSCDDGDKGRKLNHFVGRLADDYKYIPDGPPYYKQNF